MGGGQPGDTGVLRLADGSEIRIVDTRKDESDDAILHVPEALVSSELVGERVEACIDWDRRHRLMRMHTLMHLLCAVVPAGVTGGSVRDGSGRLDFDLPESTLDKDEITAALNRLVEENHSVSARWITDEELSANSDLVRTMSVKPPVGTGRVRLMDVEGVDLQPCGGTHVATTGEIGPVRVRKIEKKGKHNRRVNLEFAE
jgi:misacylated tRNA(Ala) deacylase